MVNKRELLPIGSVVEVEDGKGKTFMIYGRKIIDDKEREWDYLICAYPEGFVPGADQLGDFWSISRDQVTKLVFIGYQNKREQDLREILEDPETKGNVWDWAQA